ncbi:MAG: DRTGG domain-containing protein [Syntrophales bacterium]
METFVVTSMRPSAGKTSIIIGIAKALEKKIGYLKPFGERFLYRKKRMWDYDAALITNIFGLDENPEDMSIGFHHAKLFYMLDEETTGEKIRELRSGAGQGKDLFFVECGKDISYGASVHLDAVSLAGQLEAPLIVVASGDDDVIVDDLFFLKKYVNLHGVNLRGVIINKVANLADFRDTRLPRITAQGIAVLGVIPYSEELPLFSVGYLVDRLFAKVITCEEQLGRTVKQIFIASMSVGDALKKPLFQEKQKVVITGGDRADMIAAALETGPTALILTNGMLPPADLLAKAASRDIPLLLVSADLYETAKQVEGLESLPTKDDTEKIDMVTRMVRTHVDLAAFSPAADRQ